MSANYLPVIVVLICQWLPTALLWPNHDISTLKLLQVVHRHGDRTPENWFPNDPFKNLSEYWYEGEGELTTHGKYRMYKIGQTIRDNYQSYLGDEYSPREVYARSSTKHRCLESAALVLSGAYPPNNTKWKWSEGNDSLLGQYWQPFPIEAFLPMDEDRLLRNDAYCPIGKERQREIYFSSQVKSFLANYKPFLRELERKIGRKFVDIEDINDFRDTISLEFDRGYKWSNFSLWNTTFEKTAIDTLYTIAKFYWSIRYDDLLLQRIRAGPLIDELMQNIRNGMNRTVDQKVMFYSTHDTKLNVLMQALKVYDNQTIMPFGTTLLFELHQNPNSGPYFVRIYLLNETLPEHSPFLLQLPECDLISDCPIDKFLSLTSRLISLDWEYECGISRQESHPLTSLNIVLLIVNIILVVIFLTILIVIWCRRRRDSYQSLG